MNLFLKNFGRFCAFVAVAGLAVVVFAQGSVEIDGSSTVAPISSAVAEEFGGNVSVAISGTSGGFRRFCPGNGPGSGETDISGASRNIRASEITRCATDEVEFIELPVAFDGLSVAVDRDQQIWPEGVPVCLTVGELQLMWSIDSEDTILNWSDVRPDLANTAITFTGAAETSGTRGSFIEDFLNLEAQREDGFFTEDDQLLAQQTSEDPFGITYFGFAFFVNNADRVQAVAIDPREDVLTNSADCNGTLPTFETIEDSIYPFSRPLFIYVNADSAANNSELVDYVDFYMEFIDDTDFLADVGYVSLPGSTADKVRARWDARQTGSSFCNDGTTDENLDLATDCPGE